MDRAGWSLRYFLEKVKEWHFNSTLNEVIWPKKFQIPCTDQKMPFGQFLRQGRDGRVLLVRPSRIPHRISKILFALGADKFLAMLDGKIREAPFFKIRSDKITVCNASQQKRIYNRKTCGREKVEIPVV